MKTRIGTWLAKAGLSIVLGSCSLVTLLALVAVMFGRMSRESGFIVIMICLMAALEAFSAWYEFLRNQD